MIIVVASSMTKRNGTCIGAQSAFDRGYLRLARRHRMRFDLVDLSLFRHVVEAGSITHGAERLSDEVVGLIGEGVGDLGIVAATVDVSSLETYPFRKDRFVLVVARDHPLARRSRIAFAQLLEHEFVGLDRASALQRFLADKAARIGQPLRLRVQLRSFDAVCRLVECNVGIGIVPETTAQRVGRTMAITAVALSDSWAARDLTICVRKLAELPPYARQLVDHLRAGA